MIRGFLDAGGVRGWVSAHGYFLDRPLIYANLSQSHLALSQALRSCSWLETLRVSRPSLSHTLKSMLVANRHRSARCWTRASALAAWFEETQDRIRNKETEQSESPASAEARVKHLAERWRLDTSILFRVCESEEIEMRLA